MEDHLGMAGINVSGCLNISGTNAKNALHRYLGYGEPMLIKLRNAQKSR